jgi:hypothetical protein
VDFGELLMKDVMELLRAKEQELSKVKRQVEALRIALPLLRTEDDPLVPSATDAGNKVAGKLS